MGAEKWVEFIHTGYEPPLAASKAAADAIGVPFAWMANKYAATYANKGVKWTNLDVKYIKDGISDTSDAIHTVESFTDRGIALSVYTIDDVTTVDYYAKRSDIKAITTNYPSRMLSRLKNMKN
jgi:glycerophosphoryl diester phosphodiesterase